MSWLDHIDQLNVKTCQRLGALRRFKHLLPRNARITLYNRSQLFEARLA